MKQYAFIILCLGSWMGIATAQKKSAIKATTQTAILRPLLSVKIKATAGRIRTVDDLKVVITFTNNSGRMQKFLLDRPGPLPHGMTCILANAQGKSMICEGNRAAAETHNYPPNTFDRYHYDLAPRDWLMKVYPITDLVIFDPAIVKKGRLPAGRYLLQLDFQGNRSNTISFFAE